MLFCKKCGSIMVPGKEKGKNITICKNCDFKSTEVQDTKLTESVKKSKVEVGVVEKEVEIKPIVNVDCPKCEHKKAYFWSEQTRAGDEGETRFFRCEKCKHTWREYE